MYLCIDFSTTIIIIMKINYQQQVLSHLLIVKESQRSANFLKLILR